MSTNKKEIELNLLEVLKRCEPNIAQIKRDTGVSRQSIYSWESRLPRRGVFNKLLKMDKYRKELEKIDYEGLRAKTPLGRRPKQ